MALTKQTATGIVAVVRKDAESQRRIDSWLSAAGGTQVGAVRNYAMAFVNTYTPFFDPGEASTDALVCTGIASRTAEVLKNELKGAKNSIPDVAAVDTDSRSEPYEHSATLIVMGDQSKYIFDWWKTLDINNPLVYKHADWKANMGGVEFVHFSGYSDMPKP